MAWLRPMGRESVEYHRSTVLGRADDHPGAALAYYGSRGETPLRWFGKGAPALGLTPGSTVTDEQYEAIYGPGGARHPDSGAVLARTSRPGIELVVAPPKSVALLGLVGLADEMHAIADEETSVTLAYLESQIVGGDAGDGTRFGGARRGHAGLGVRSGTLGLTCAITRHATSRAGDPSVHDHVLIANVVTLADGSTRALDTALIRDHLQAATAYGRLAAFRKAYDLGLNPVPVKDRNGGLSLWEVSGFTDEELRHFSKRAAEIDGAVGELGGKKGDGGPDDGRGSHAARTVLARTTRTAKKGHEDVDRELMPRWAAEWDRLSRPLAQAREVFAHVRMMALARHATPERVMPVAERDRLVAELLVAELLADGSDLTSQKRFFRRQVVVAAHRMLWGHRVDELDRLTSAVLADREAIALVPIRGATERAYSTATTIAREERIRAMVDRGMTQPVPPGPTRRAVDRVIRHQEHHSGHRLTAGQEAMVRGICTSLARVTLVEGHAGTGKSTALDEVRAAFEADGYRVLGTATSGAAARSLAESAHIARSSTVASLLWRAEHGQLRLGPMDLIALDEAGMTADGDFERLLALTETTGTRLVAVGDSRQLSPVGPGGVLAHAVGHHPGQVYVLDEAVRFKTPGEAEALEELRYGKVDTWTAWAAGHDRIKVSPTRDEVLDNMVADWAADTAAGHQAEMYAWRRSDVTELNRRAREAMVALGRVSEETVEAPDGTVYGVGDRVVLLDGAVDGKARVVTSQRGTVRAVSVDRDGTVTLEADMAGGGRWTFTDAELDHVAPAWAVTCHRSQGATVDRGHVLFEPGVARELLYVGLSRGSDTNTVHLEADDFDQAVADLCGVKDRTERFVIDSDRILSPTHAAEVRRIETARAVGRARSVDRQRELDQDLDISM